MTLFTGRSCCRVLLLCTTAFLELEACCPLWMGHTYLTCESCIYTHTNTQKNIHFHAGLSRFTPSNLLHLSVSSMVNLREIKLHIGVDYGKKNTSKQLQNTHMHTNSHSPSDLSLWLECSSCILCPYKTSVCLLPSRWFMGELQRVHLPNHETTTT